MNASARGLAGIYVWLCCAIAPCFLLSDFEAWPSGVGGVAALQTLMLSLASAAASALLALPSVWLAGRVAATLARRLSPPAHAALVALALFAAVAGSAWFFIWPDVRQTLHPDRQMCLLAGAAAGMIVYVNARLRGASARGTRGAVLFSLLAGFVVAAFQVTLDARKYIELHDLAELLLIIALGTASSGAIRSGSAGRLAGWAPLGLLPLLGSVALASWWNGPEAAFRAAGAESNRLSRRLSGLARVVWDRDNDGHAAWIYPGDCDDNDASVHPGAAELRDGRDANCNGQRPELGAWPARAALEPPSGGDVLLVSIDALVPAALSQMPRLSGLAHSGVDLRRCYAGGTATALSLPLFFRPNDSAPPVTDALARQGIVVEAWLDRISFPDIPAARRVGSSAAAIEGFLTALAAPEPHLRFSWMHLFDLHEPGEATTLSGGTATGAAGVSPAYASAARGLDDKLAHLFSELQGSERGRGTRLIITGDHGEAFGAHGFTGHGSSGYEEVVRTPCILLGPALPALVYDGAISQRGLPATLLALFGSQPAARAAETLADGWLRVLEPQRAPRPQVVVRSMRYASGAIGHQPLAILVSGRFKLVEGLEDGGLELYDLVADPAERINLAARHSAELPALRAQLGQMVDADGFPSPATYVYRNFLFGVTSER